MNKEWRPIRITTEGARRALAVGGITDNATGAQLSLVTAAQHRLGHVTIFIRNPRDENLAEVDAVRAGLILLPAGDKIGLPAEATAEDLSVYRRVFGQRV